VNATAAKFLDAIRRGDRRAAFAVIDDALDRSETLNYVHHEIITPSLREIGRLWQQNVLSVAEEHLASGISQAAMNRAFERTFLWKDKRTRRIIAACVATEQHCIGLRMVCDLFELDGWDAIYLGATVPIDSLIAMIRDKKPDVVAISAAIDPHIPRVQEAITALRGADLPNQPLIAVGGRAFLSDASLAKRVGADVTAPDGEQALRIINHAIRNQADNR
jgi:methanogenic corrinoid protein MtbC1